MTVHAFPETPIMKFSFVAGIWSENDLNHGRFSPLWDRLMDNLVECVLQQSEAAFYSEIERKGKSIEIFC